MTEEEVAWAKEQLSDKDQRRYEHEQSQMELMQFVEQLRTVGPHTVAVLPAQLPRALESRSQWLNRVTWRQGGFDNQFVYLRPMRIDDFPANPYHLKVRRSHHVLGRRPVVDRRDACADRPTFRMRRRGLFHLVC